MHIDNTLRLDFKDVLIRPKRSTLISRSEVDITRDFKFLHAPVAYHGIPVIAANMDTTGTFEMAKALDPFMLSAALDKHYSEDELVKFFTELERKATAFYTLGIGDDDWEKFQSVNRKAPGAVQYVCIDVANGYTERFVNFIKKVRDTYPDLVIMAGNVVTGDMTEALKLADYAITEAGFGADLGAEKFLDIKCRMADLHPSAVVIVATVRALKYNGGVAKADLNNENLEALEKGIPNLLKHVSNIKNVYKLPCVVAINAFPTDTKAELDFVEAKCKELGVNVALSEVWAKGGEGGIKLAEEVLRLVEEPNDFSYAYELEGSIEDKLNQIVQKVYGGKRVVLTANAQKQAKQLEALGFGNCPICVAKTQYSLTDDQTKLGAPTDFEVTVRNLKISAGAGFIVALTGEIMTMPGLPKVPAAERIDVDETGKITGLF